MTDQDIDNIEAAAVAQDLTGGEIHVPAADILLLVAEVRRLKAERDTLLRRAETVEAILSDFTADPDCAYLAGRADERVAVVAWLREQMTTGMMEVAGTRWATDVIEVGLPDPPPPGATLARYHAALEALRLIASGNAGPMPEDLIEVAKKALGEVGP